MSGWTQSGSEAYEQAGRNRPERHWTAAVLLDTWNLYDQKPITNDDLDQELRREH